MGINPAKTSSNTSFAENPCWSSTSLSYSKRFNSFTATDLIEYKNSVFVLELKGLSGGVGVAVEELPLSPPPSPPVLFRAPPALEVMETTVFAKLSKIWDLTRPLFGTGGKVVFLLFRWARGSVGITTINSLYCKKKTEYSNKTQNHKN